MYLTCVRYILIPSFFLTVIQLLVGLLMSDRTTQILAELENGPYKLNLTEEKRTQLAQKITNILESESPPEPEAPLPDSVPAPPAVNRDITSNIRLIITDKPNSLGSYISGYDTMTQADAYPFTPADEVSAFITKLLGESDKVYMYTPNATKQTVAASSIGGKKTRSRRTKSKSKSARQGTGKGTGKGTRKGTGKGTRNGKAKRGNK